MAKVLRRREVEAKVGLSHMQIYRLERTGDFPLRVHLGPNSVGWIEAEVEAWIAARAEARTPSAKAA